METVLLVGGPFDGQHREVERVRNVLTIEWVQLATYQRVDEHTFRHCRTPTALGDNDLSLPVVQLTMLENDL